MASSCGEVAILRFIEARATVIGKLWSSPASPARRGARDPACSATVADLAPLLRARPPQAALAGHHQDADSRLNLQFNPPNGKIEAGSRDDVVRASVLLYGVNTLLFHLAGHGIRLTSFVRTESRRHTMMSTDRPIIIVRRTEPRDAISIHGLGVIEDGFAVSPWSRFYLLDDLQQWIARPEDDILLSAEHNDVLVGFLLCRVVRRSWAMLENLEVHPSYRNRGIGHRLLDDCVQQLRRRQIVSLHGLVREDNQAIRFFTDNDFIPGYRFRWIERRLADA
jgi:ribosomal protein S18 acetylase RimI-like enzyme